MKMPTRNDAERCLAIRRKGKRGEYLPKTDSDFSLRMFKKYPEWFSVTENRIFNETAPFGSERSLSEEALPPYSDEQEAK